MYRSGPSSAVHAPTQEVGYEAGGPGQARGRCDTTTAGRRRGHHVRITGGAEEFLQRGHASPLLITIGIAIIIALQQVPAALGVKAEGEKVITVTIDAAQAWPADLEAPEGVRFLIRLGC
jgi:hypothetical protein